MSRMCSAALLLSLAAGAAAADPAAPLRDALAGIPQGAADGTGLGPAFADVAAAAEVLAGMDLGAYDPWVAGPIGPLGLAAPLGRDPEPGLMAETAWPRLVGFGPDDIASVVNFGAPPEDAVRIALRPGAMAAAVPVLVANGYAEAATPFGPLLRRGDQDFAISFDSRNPDDPFGGMLGESSRVLVQGDVLIRAAGMAPLEAAMAGPFWGDRGDLAALLGALSGLPADSVILRAQLLTDQRTFMGGEVTALAQDFLDGTAPADLALPDDAVGIPPWSLGIMADAVVAGDPAAVFGFVYATEIQARDAAARLADGWEMPSPVSGQAPARLIGPATREIVGAGPFVLLLTATGDWSAEGAPVNQPFAQALRAVYERDLPVFGLPF